MTKRNHLMLDTEHDELTGLAGPGLVRTTLSQWKVAAAATGQSIPIHAMMLGLGRFDTVNLAFGTAAGDGALIEVARRIMLFAEDELESAPWCVGRLGGGQFMVLAKGACTKERWQWLAEALADAVAHPIAGFEGAGAVRLWPRIALMRGELPVVADLIIEGLAGSLEKVQGEQGRRIIWADNTGSITGMSASTLEAHLLSAIDRDEIAINYQPMVSLDDGRTIGAEALARWQHPELGRIGASALFGIAERADHIAPLSRHIAERALSEAKGWADDLRLSLNIAPVDLAAASFAQDFGALLDRSGFPAERLTIEITEQVLLADLDLARRSLTQLKERGVRVALDDFGAGFCNFRYLKMLPLDYIKLDRAMVDGIAHDEQDLAVLRAIIAMARALDIEVIAEGIESEEQRRIIAEEGCTLFQGFLESEPLESSELEEFIAG